MLPFVPLIVGAGVLYTVHNVDQQSKTVPAPQQPTQKEQTVEQEQNDDKPAPKRQLTKRQLAFSSKICDDDEDDDDDDEDYKPTTKNKKLKTATETTQVKTKPNNPFACLLPKAVEEHKPKRTKTDPDPNLAKVDQWKKIREDFYVSNVKGDGNCLFKALVKALWFTETPDKMLLSDHEDKLAADLRNKIVGYIRKNSKEFKDITFMIKNKTMPLEKYLKAMTKPTTWGGQIEIAAYCNMNNKRVNIWIYENTRMTCMVEGESKTGGTIDVYWNGKNHYMAALRV